jgi:hypothetical protein
MEDVGRPPRESSGAEPSRRRFLKRPAAGALVAAARASADDPSVRARSDLR